MEYDYTDGRNKAEGQQFNEIFFREKLILIKKKNYLETPGFSDRVILSSNVNL